MRERNEREDGRADDDEEHAEIKQEHAREVELSDDRQRAMKMCEVRKGYPAIHAPAPVSVASNSPVAIQRTG